MEQRKYKNKNKIINGFIDKNEKKLNSVKSLRKREYMLRNKNTKLRRNTPVVLDTKIKGLPKKPIKSNTIIEHSRLPGKVYKKGPSKFKVVAEGKNPDALEEENIDYSSLLMNRFLLKKLVNKAFKSGKKAKVRKFFVKIFLKLQLAFKCNAFILLHNIFRNLAPLTHTLRIKRRGKFKDVPVVATKKRQLFLAISWFIKAIKIKLGFPRFEGRILKEIYDLSGHRGLSMTYKRKGAVDVLRTRTLVHFRWKIR